MQYMINFMESFKGEVQGKINLSPHDMPVEINVGSHKLFDMIRYMYHPPKKHTNFWKVKSQTPYDPEYNLSLAENVKRYAVPAGYWYIWDREREMFISTPVV